MMQGRSLHPMTTCILRVDFAVSVCFYQK